MLLIILRGNSAGQVEVYGINPYQFVWDVDNGNNSAPSDGSYAATVSGTDLAGNSYLVGTESITFTLDTSGPTVILTDTDADNLIPLSAIVTITAAFSEVLHAYNITFRSGYQCTYDSYL